MCRLRLVMGAEKGPRGVCSGPFALDRLRVASAGMVAGLLGVMPSAGGPAVAGAAVGARGGVTVGGMKKSRLAAGVGSVRGLCALSGPVGNDPVALGVGDAGELV